MDDASENYDELDETQLPADISRDDEDSAESVSPFRPPVRGHVKSEDVGLTRDIGLLNDVEVTATVELGRTHLPIREVLKLRRGAVVELEKLVGQPADLLINNMPMAKGEVIVVNERFGFRISKFSDPKQG